MTSWNIKSRILTAILLVGDIFALALSLWAALFLRYFSPPYETLVEHIPAFTWVFLLWILSFYLSGFYSAFLVGYRLSLAQELLKVHAVNGLLSVLFFYLIPYFAITPKINLLLFILISYFLLFFWRIASAPILKKAIGRGIFYFIGPAAELEEVVRAFENNSYYSGFRIFAAKAAEKIASEADVDFTPLESKAASGIFSAVAATLPYEHNEKLVKKFYASILKGVHFFDFQKFYEAMFHKIPISLVNEMWFLENISSRRRLLFDFLKRVIDLAVSLVLGFASLSLHPFIMLAIKLDDGGPVFYVPNRVGRNGRVFKLFKFRTMRVNADARWPERNDPRVTKVGRFLRKAALDEIPQLWNLFKGDVSLVGPRPDLVDFAEILRKEIPYYDVRTIMKPGLTGWAQVSQKVSGENPSSVAETRERLAYDIYYIKNRSFLLDMAILIKTLRALWWRIRS